MKVQVCTWNPSDPCLTKLDLFFKTAKVKGIIFPKCCSVLISLSSSARCLRSLIQWLPGCSYVILYHVLPSTQYGFSQNLPKKQVRSPTSSLKRSFGLESKDSYHPVNMVHQTWTRKSTSTKHDNGETKKTCQQSSSWTKKNTLRIIGPSGKEGFGSV